MDALDEGLTVLDKHWVVEEVELWEGEEVVDSVAEAHCDAESVAVAFCEAKAVAELCAVAEALEEGL